MVLGHFVPDISPHLPALAQLNSFFFVARIRNAFAHYKKEPLFEANQLYLLSVGLAVSLKINLSKSNLGLNTD